MPEGHTLHRLARSIDTAFAGTTPLVASPQGRFVEGAALLDGTVLERAWAHGKLLFVDFEQDRSLYVHLGLIGKWFVQPVAPEDAELGPAVAGEVRLRIADERHVADLRGPMACQLVDPLEVARLVARQGPDPLQQGQDSDAAYRKISASGRTIAELLMDQTVLAGVGNIYRCEVLWRHRVQPLKPGRSIKRVTWQLIWDDLVALMPWGVRTGAIITLDDVLEDTVAAFARGETPEVPREFAVYQRTGMPCLRCGSTVRTKVVAGRNLFWCGGCQRRT
ncbi:MAG: DNA-formamidopyrimidine glycosylase family protein [Ornithinimicrobium sp.]|uniref:Fpg/Nei family DNA glycosylase n=1 Tax=Ornithinimicrobium sp. TaxID=1977084 RepID=UPI0026E10189|nr:DNA-formamidopyrimidine glycosylase family protein [Ornithinimicrobium sp.]MDO5740711.1 DNA-formamidopyrimidine glycosylase family protein [Ornithinimicrobium sp.]